MGKFFSAFVHSRQGIIQIPILLIILISAAAVVPVTYVLNQANLDTRDKACTWECTASCGCGCSDYFDARPQCRQSAPAPAQPAPQPKPGACTSTGCTYYSCTQKLNTDSCGARVLAAGFCQTNYPASNPCNITTTPSNPTTPSGPTPQPPPPGGKCPTGQWDQCGGCLAGKCVDSTKTCNTLIDQLCAQTGCGGNGVVPPAGQTCCSNLVLYSNGRCGPPTSSCIGDGGSKPASGGLCCTGLKDCGITCVASTKSCPAGTAPVPTPTPTPALRPVSIGSTCPPGSTNCACEGGQIPPGEQCLISSNSTTGCTADTQCETRYCAPLVSGQTVRKCTIRPATPTPRPTPRPIPLGSTCPVGAGTCSCGLGGSVPQGELCAKGTNETCQIGKDCETGYCNLAFRCGPSPVAKSPGAKCDSGTDCRCAGGVIVANGILCPTLTNGGICVSSSECTSNYCNAAKRCETRLPPLSAGQTCTNSAGCTCTWNSTTITIGGLCSKKAPFSSCATSSECTSGICTLALCRPNPTPVPICTVGDFTYTSQTSCLQAGFTSCTSLTFGSSLCWRGNKPPSPTPSPTANPIIAAAQNPTACTLCLASNPNKQGTELLQACGTQCAPKSTVTTCPNNLANCQCVRDGGGISYPVRSGQSCTSGYTLTILPGTPIPTPTVRTVPNCRTPIEFASSVSNTEECQVSGVAGKYQCKTGYYKSGNACLPGIAPTIFACASPNTCVPSSACTGATGTSAIGSCPQSGFVCCKLNSTQAGSVCSRPHGTVVSGNLYCCDGVVNNGQCGGAAKVVEGQKLPDGAWCYQYLFDGGSCAQCAAGPGVTHKVGGVAGVGGRDVCGRGSQVAVSSPSPSPSPSIVPASLTSNECRRDPGAWICGSDCADSAVRNLFNRSYSDGRGEWLRQSASNQNSGKPSSQWMSCGGSLATTPTRNPATIKRQGEVCFFTSGCLCVPDQGSSYQMSGNGAVCGTPASSSTTPTTSLTRISSGEICNETGGCACYPSGTLTASGTQIKKFDVCGGSATVAFQATCTSQCVAGNTCPGTSTNGVGSCPANFKCCAPLDNLDTQTVAQQQCVRAYNSTGQIGSLECERYLVSSGVATQTEINSSRGSRAVANTALDVAVGVAERVEINSVRFDAVTQALNRGEIDPVTASALYAYIAADLVTLGQLDATNNSVQFAKQQCQVSNAAACAAHWAGALGNSVLLSAEFVPKAPKAVVSTLTDPLSPGLSSSDELVNSLTPSPGSTNSISPPCPLVFGISTDPESIAYEETKGKILGCTFNPVEDALSYDARTGKILDAQGNLYNTGSNLGSGAYSNVYVGQNNTVVKILNESVLSRDYAYDAALNQMDFLLGVPQDSGYPNISRIIVDSEDQTLLRGLEMERIVGQSLEDFFAAGNTITANEADALVEELNRIHTVTGRAHGDLAVGGELVNPANIMIHEDGRILFLDPSGLNPQSFYTDYAKQSELNSLIQGLEPYTR